MACASISGLKIKKGSTFAFTITLEDENNCDLPIPLSGFTGASAYFPQDGSATPLAVTGSLVSADLGKVSFSLSAAQTALLEEGDSQSMEVEVQHNSEVTIAQLLNKVEVLPRLF